MTYVKPELQIMEIQIEDIMLTSGEVTSEELTDLVKETVTVNIGATNGENIFNH